MTQSAVRPGLVSDLFRRTHPIPVDAGSLQGLGRMWVWTLLPGSDHASKVVTMCLQT